MRSQAETPPTAVTLPAEADDLAATLEVPAASARPRYDTIKVIGEGGMGHVLLARDRVIGREVAMKVMRSDRADRRDLRGRFLREVLVQGQLEHPSIVPVYDLMAAPDGAPSFTMKHVRGVTLEEVVAALRKGDAYAQATYTRHKLLTAFGSVCLGVELAHARGVLHRDLKPSNIMLGNFGEVYILDWGVSKLAGDAREAVAAMNESAAQVETLAGNVMGTPGFMAPERLTEGARVDARSDIYSLGAILFELLALEPLHIAGVTGRSLNSSARQGTDARPSVRAPHLGIAPELDVICLKATALSSEDRYRSCRHLYEALERFLEGDRDLERRRQLAKELVDRTRSALSTGSFRTDASARGDAIRDLGRALALDPTSTSAADSLLRILTAPPSELPEDAEASWFEEERGLERVRARAGAVAFAMWLSVLPFGIWSGVRSWGSFGVTTAAFLVASAALLLASRRPPKQGFSPPHLAVLAFFAILTTYPFFGPLVGLPGLAAAAALGFSIAPSPRVRALPVVLALLVTLAPVVLELAGVIAPSYRFEDGMMCIVPRAAVMQRVPAYLFLGSVNAVLIALGGYFGLTLGRALTRAHQRLHLQSWQLHQLIPREVRAARGKP
jgi:eukaryotic-like serine/threonine-protein kinase